MRISSSTVLLIKLKGPNDLSVTAKNRLNDTIDITVNDQNGTKACSIPVRLPDCIYLELSSGAEIVEASLAGVRFNRDKLSSVAKFHTDRYIEINLFDVDPFLYHLNIGTNILI